MSYYLVIKYWYWYTLYMAKYIYNLKKNKCIRIQILSEYS